MSPAFQDLIPRNHCFGCGPDNAGGLRIKSHWDDDGNAICLFSPQPQHCAGPTHVVNGGIIATIIDCHAICTAMADAYRRDGRAIGSGETIWYVTGHLNLDYHAPAAIDRPIRLRAQIEAVSGRKTSLAVTALSGEVVCARAKVLAIRVTDEWLNAQARIAS